MPRSKHNSNEAFITQIVVRRFGNQIGLKSKRHEFDADI